MEIIRREKDAIDIYDDFIAPYLSIGIVNST
jgi:hypothetical protein